MGLTVLEIEVGNPTNPEVTEKIDFLIDSGAIYSGSSWINSWSFASIVKTPTNDSSYSIIKKIFVFLQEIKFQITSTK